MPHSLARWEARHHSVEATILVASQRGFQPRDPERARVSKLRPAIPPRTIYISEARLPTRRVRSASTPALTPPILLITILQHVEEPVILLTRRRGFGSNDRTAFAATAGDAGHH